MIHLSDSLNDLLIENVRKFLTYIENICDVFVIFFKLTNHNLVQCTNVAVLMKAANIRASI